LLLDALLILRLLSALLFLGSALWLLTLFLLLTPLLFWLRTLLLALLFPALILLGVCYHAQLAE
jgi:hypothetical protein